jgi:hypothetical protein
VPNSSAAANAILGALKRGGRTYHHVPNRGHPDALILRLIGNKWQRRLLSVLEPAEGETTGGYPTFFDECNPGRMADAY